LNSHAQQNGPKPDATIDAATRRQVIDAALAALDEVYVFPEVATKMRAAVRGRLERGEYDKIANGPAFAELLTLHLEEVSGDRHLGVGYSAEPIPVAGAHTGPTPEEIEGYRAYGRATNFGFERAE